MQCLQYYYIEFINYFKIVRGRKESDICERVEKASVGMRKAEKYFEFDKNYAKGLHFLFH